MQLIMRFNFQEVMIMKMKKLALLLVAPVVLAACGNEQAPAEPEETATESVVEENKKVDEKEDKKIRRYS